MKYEDRIDWGARAVALLALGLVLEKFSWSSVLIVMAIWCAVVDVFTMVGYSRGPRGIGLTGGR